MSSILKALKKLEDDKAVLKPDELKIDAEILRSVNPPLFSSSGIILTAVLLLAGGSGITYMFMKKDKAPEFVNPKTASISVQKQPNTLVESDIKTEQLPADVVVVPAQQQRAAKAKSSEIRQTPLPVRTTPSAEITRPARTAVASTPSKPEKTAESPKSSPPSSPAKAIPAIRVNGIAFQGTTADSVAIINGLPASSGSLIDGVKIEEIQKNKVRFSYNGEKFEVFLGQSNR